MEGVIGIQLKIKILKGIQEMEMSALVAYDNNRAAITRAFSVIVIVCNSRQYMSLSPPSVCLVSASPVRG